MVKMRGNAWASETGRAGPLRDTTQHHIRGDGEVRQMVCHFSPETRHLQQIRALQGHGGSRAFGCGRFLGRVLSMGIDAVSMIRTDSFQALSSSNPSNEQLSKGCREGH